MIRHSKWMITACLCTACGEGVRIWFEKEAGKVKENTLPLLEI